MRAGKKGLPTATKRAAVYTRKSTSQGLEQEFNSLDAQRDCCVNFIRQQGWTLVDQKYDDGGFTGANIERPAFQRMLADIEAGKIDVVVVYKVDRLSRSLLDFAKVMERLNDAGASFVSVTQNFSTADAMGRLTLNMLMSFAEFEREMICERTRDKIAGARRKGKWTGGPPPLGYTVVEKRLVVEELEAVVVREVFDLYVQQHSALAVARLLNEHGRSTKRHRTADGNVREGHKWTKHCVLRVLKNPVYAGLMASGGELYKAEHTPLIERATFERVQDLLDGAARATKAPGRNPEYILRGVLRCACCGSTFTPASTTRRTKVHRYYRCVKKDKEGKEACPSSPLPAGEIEAYVYEQLKKATADGSLAADVTEQVKSRVAQRRKDLVVERKKLPQEVASLSAEARRTVDSLSGMTGTARQLVEQRLHEIGEQLARTESQLATAEREIANLDAVQVEASWVGQCLTDFDKVWDVLTPENRGRLLRAVIQRVEVDEAANKVRVHLAELGLDAAGSTQREEAA
jgi:DNA invertase Pin-like site-specific DNA recombinase